MSPVPVLYSALWYPLSTNTMLGSVLGTSTTLGISSTLSNSLNECTSNSLNTSAILGISTALVLPNMAGEASGERTL